MQPAFRLVRDSLEVSRDRCRQWYHHEGAFMTEGLMMKGVSVFNSLPGHLRYHFLGTIEMTAMMSDYIEYTTGSEVCGGYSIAVRRGVHQVLRTSLPQAR